MNNLNKFNRCFINSCINGDIENLKQSLEKGATMIENGFYSSCLCGNIEIVKFLLSKFKIQCINYTKIDLLSLINRYDKDNDQPLLIANSDKKLLKLDNFKEIYSILNNY